MKQDRLEALRCAQKEYHRTHPWRLSKGGLFIPHSYAYNTPESLSWWDDVGFILNGRRIIVWWQHPRNVYKDAIEDQTWAEVGDGPEDNWLTEGGTKIYRRVGRSRKKLVGTSLREPSAERSAYHERLTAARKKLQTDGIDFEVRPTWKWKRLSWAMSVSLVVPMEVRNEVELAAVAALAKRLIRQETSLAKEFPNACYRREDWLQDMKLIRHQESSALSLSEDAMKQWKSDAFERLKNEVETIVQESGRPGEFDAEKWLNSWLNTPVGALGGKEPAEYMGTDEGVELISNLLRQIQYSVYA